MHIRTCKEKVLMAGIGMSVARKNPHELVMEVSVIFGPTLRSVSVILFFSEISSGLDFNKSSSSKNESPMTNMSSTPSPRTRNGRTCTQDRQAERENFL